MVTIICELFEIIGHSVCPTNNKKTKANALSKFKSKYNQYLKKLQNIRMEDPDLTEFAKVAIESLITLKEEKWHRKKVCVNTLIPKALHEVEKDLYKHKPDGYMQPNPLNTVALQNETIVIGMRNEHPYKKYINNIRQFDIDDYLIIHKVNRFKTDSTMIRQLPS